MKINLTQKNITILGYGREWDSTLRFLQKYWIQDKVISIRDKNHIENIPDFHWQIISWNDYLSDLEKYDYIFFSPWISPYTNNLLHLKDKILTQTKLFFQNYVWKIISVTGTKWKSTTATLCYELLKNAWYNVKLVWNIWNPVLDEVNLNQDNYDFVIYELSSYMLEFLDNHHSYISILLNIFSDHIDWHKWFDNYKKAKLNILKNSQNILIWLDLYKEIKPHLLKLQSLTFGPEWAYYSHIQNDFLIKQKKVDILINPQIPWNHNLNNFAWILWVCDIIWVDTKIFEHTINNFSWLPHRLQNIWTVNWIIFIDDAISTTPESTIEAIKSFENQIDTIFLGWTDRWYDFNQLVDILKQYNIRNIVLFPESSKRIKKLLDENIFNILETDNMKDWVKFAFENTKKWKICLLSTASPSYSLWKNFEEKWDEFKKEVFTSYF